MKVEVFAGLAASIDLAFAVVIGLYLRFELDKERFRVRDLFAGVAAALIKVRVVELSKRSSLLGSVLAAFRK